MAGSEYQSWEEVNEAFQRAAALINREHQKRGKQFRDTQDGRRKHRRPRWSRHYGLMPQGYSHCQGLHNAEKRGRNIPTVGFHASL